MGIFNRNNNNQEELLVILSEIRDNLKTNNDDVLKELESKIADAKYSNDEEIGVWANRVIELEKTVNLQTKQLDENYQLITQMQNTLEKYTKMIEKYLAPKPPITSAESLNEWQNRFQKKYEGTTIRPYTNRGVKCNGFELRTASGSAYNQLICNIIQLTYIYDNLESICEDLVKNNNFEKYEKDLGLNQQTSHLAIKRILLTLIMQEEVFLRWINYYKKDFTFTYHKNYLFIDNHRTLVKKGDLKEIKAIVVNNGSLTDTIPNLIKLYNHIDEKHIVIICLNIHKIRYADLEDEQRVRNENDVKGRF